MAVRVSEILNQGGTGLYRKVYIAQVTKQNAIITGVLREGCR
jgi:hypothetical protein